MILHTVNKSPFSDNTLADCLRLCSAGDAVLLIEDGVYAVQQATEVQQLLAQRPDIEFFALGKDLEARGLQHQAQDIVLSITDEDFVELTVKYPRIQSWY